MSKLLNGGVGAQILMLDREVERRRRGDRQGEVKKKCTEMERMESGWGKRERGVSLPLALLGYLFEGICLRLFENTKVCELRHTQRWVTQRIINDLSTEEHRTLGRAQASGVSRCLKTLPDFQHFCGSHEPSLTSVCALIYCKRAWNISFFVFWWPWMSYA